MRFLRQAVIALTAFLTVVDLFATQAILPSLVKHYGVSPAAMSLAVNATTFGMAFAGLGVALIGHRIDRRLGILVSLAALSIPTFLLASAPSLAVFTALRITQGVFMSAAFGLTLAYLGEELSAEDARGAFAAYITGNVASNLIGRLIAAAVADHAGLAANFYVFAALNLAGAALAYFTVRRTPPMEPAAGEPTAEEASTIDMPMARMKSWTAHLRNPELAKGFAIGFCILFAFIGTFTFVNFVLTRPPVSLGMMQLGLVYLVFLPSIFTTPLAGWASTRFGLKQALVGGLVLAVLGLPLLLTGSLDLILLGLVLVGVGTFFAQAIATGYVSLTATFDRAAASGLYLASYFLGGLAGSAILGQIFDHWGWGATVLGIGVPLGIAALIAQTLAGSDPAGCSVRNRHAKPGDAILRPRKKAM